MRKILTFSCLVVLGLAVGCSHIDNGCSSCGCGGSVAHGAGSHHPCTLGVCDCDIPPIAPYGMNRVNAPLAPVPAPVQVAAQSTDTPREMPKANGDAQ